MCFTQMDCSAVITLCCYTGKEEVGFTLEYNDLRGSPAGSAPGRKWLQANLKGHTDEVKWQRATLAGCPLHYIILTSGRYSPAWLTCLASCIAWIMLSRL